MYVYADKLGLTLVPLNTSDVIAACEISIPHSDVGNYGSMVANPSLKWLLNIWIYLSLRLAL